VLGLPDAVRACLLDLDGVLTRSAEVHAALRAHGASSVVQDLAELLDDA
jgi:phosphoglycolate phosphatase-like HAD superfamily hydrolase